MPRASELEEFGLEVESEHHALIAEQNSARKSRPLGVHFELSSPTKQQIALLQSTNTPRKGILRPGMLRWATLVIVLAIIVFMNIGQERDDVLIEEELEDLEAKKTSGGLGKDWVEDGGEYRVFGNENKGGEEKETVKNADLEAHADENDADDDGGEIDAAEEIIDEEHFDLESKAETEPDGVDVMDENDADDKIVDGDNEADPETEVTGEDSEQLHNHAADNEDTSDSETGTAQTVESKAEQPNYETSENKAGPFTSEHLSATRKAAQSLITMLEEYYYGAETTSKMLVESWVGPWDFDAYNNEDAEPEKRDRIHKLVDTMARALVTENQNEFIIGTIGSSVAAGHDNCQYDSYENQLQRTLGPVWEAAGMKLVCQNAGEGGGCGDDFSNQVFCIKQNVSPKIDIAHYSWSYFEVGAGEKALQYRESLIRWTQMLPRQPPVHVINVEGQSPPESREIELTTYYAKYGYDAFYMRYAYRQGPHDYETEEKNGIDRFGWGYLGDGYHNTTRYGELEVDERRDSLGIVMRNWHPGPLAFQLIADAFSLVYAKAILIALDIIEGAFADGNNPGDDWDASKRKFITKKSLPEPIHCDPEYCVVDEAPGCINYELPTYGTWGARVEDPNDSLNPHKGEVQNWQMWYEPQDEWYMVSREDIVYFQDREDKKICKHLDQCAGMSAESSENGMAVFRLPKME
jgi:hypothetical protein